MTASLIAAQAPEDLPYLVKPIIPAGWNGSIIADPKILKSFSAVDLLVSLAAGQPWLDKFAGNKESADNFAVPRRARCALLAREDFWGLTARRIKQLALGRGLKPEILADFSDYLLVNTRAQQATWALDNDADLEGLIKRLKRRQCEFVVWMSFDGWCRAFRLKRVALQPSFTTPTKRAPAARCSRARGERARSTALWNGASV